MLPWYFVVLGCKQGAKDVFFSKGLQSFGCKEPWEAILLKSQKIGSIAWCNRHGITEHVTADCSAWTTAEGNLSPLMQVRTVNCRTCVQLVPFADFLPQCQHTMMQENTHTSVNIDRQTDKYTQTDLHNKNAKAIQTKAYKVLQAYKMKGINIKSEATDLRCYPSSKILHKMSPNCDQAFRLDRQMQFYRSADQSFDHYSVGLLSTNYFVLCGTCVLILSNHCLNKKPKGRAKGF